MLVASVHILLGVNADRLLGAVLPVGGIDPGIDSQNRFYGTMFGFFGIFLWIAAGNIRSHVQLLNVALAVFFCGGLARIISWIMVGQPALPVIFLMATELVFPLILWFWLRRSLREVQ